MDVSLHAGIVPSLKETERLLQNLKYLLMTLDLKENIQNFPTDIWRKKCTKLHLANLGSSLLPAYSVPYCFGQLEEGILEWDTEDNFFCNKVELSTSIKTHWGKAGKLISSWILAFKVILFMFEHFQETFGELCHHFSASEVIIVCKERNRECKREKRAQYIKDENRKQRQSQSTDLVKFLYLPPFS